VFTALMETSARAEAAASDGLRRAGVPPRPLEGLPISIKDLFDVKGAVTTASSKVLATEPPAEADAPVVARLRAAGAVLVGRTNMTEFAYSGLGINPHYGTPANPWDRASKRIPGGSSSGAAVSVADGMATVGLGTDTGGSVRIPSSLCGLAGFKPTQSRVPIAGAVPLSTSLDSIGPLAPTLECCVRVHQVLAAEPVRAIPALPVKGLRLAVPKEFVLDDLDAATAAAFKAALTRISQAGATIVDLSLPELLELPLVNAKGGFTAPESFALHERHILRDPDAFDPRVISRMLRASEQSAAEYYALVRARADIQARVAAKTSAFDAVLMPTTPRIAPPIADLVSDDAAYGSVNMAMLRNCSVGNFLDRCAATLPIHEEGTAPVGLMVMGETLADDRTLAISLGLETLFA
jgi:aspartyl-tRNA(Asn)/glutamyl-tRNA(Gln) amidotransferase subunit A